jgi:hypothetical protein
MKAIGGYLELELNHGKEYHHNAIKLNLGRTAFEYVLRAKNIKKIFLPYFTCDVMFNPVTRMGIPHEFYHIDKNLEPVFDFTKLKDSDYFLYINYFGLKDRFVKQLSGLITNLIIDNSQAFFSKPIPGIDTLYSPRKFFGVPDGGYLYTDKRLDDIFEQDISCDRTDHLLIRIDKSAEDGYQGFLKSSNKLIDQPIKTMSKLTQALLCNIDYKKVKAKRKENFMFLHERLHIKNDLKIDVSGLNSPMVYPFLCTDGANLKSKLIDKKIFVATYWKNVISTVDADSTETFLTKNLVHLPVDQRYDIAEMETILTYL